MQRFEGRRLSWPRVVIVVIVIAVVVAGSLLMWGRQQDSAKASATGRWFGAYIDATSTPFYPIGDDVGSGERVVLGFAVADPEQPCTPSWGTFYTMDGAAETFDLDRRTARVRESGGEVVVSTGGFLNDELATACTDPAALEAAYAELLDRYESHTLDLDVEGDDLTSAQGGERRAAAMKALQAERATQDEPLEVWLTLPVATGGLTADGLAEVRRMLEAGVDVSVNLMTMNFGQTRGAGQSMADASIQAARSTHAQLASLYSDVGRSIGEQTLWSHMGITPMIGQNDLVGERFTLDDAAGVNRFAIDNGLGRVSMWSANRDDDCGANYPDLTRVSNNCSGVKQDPGAFATALSAGIGSALPSSEAARPSEVEAAQATAIVDDPETSPYPIWNKEAAYTKGDRSVWRGNVYEAKWWNQGEVPDAPVGDSGTVPWSLVGPVLPGDRPEPQAVVPAGLYPKWSAKNVYTKGDRVLFDGRILEAKWWNQAASPEAVLQGSPESPWKTFTNAETRSIVERVAQAKNPGK